MNTVHIQYENQMLSKVPFNQNITEQKVAYVERIYCECALQISLTYRNKNLILLY